MNAYDIIRRANGNGRVTFRYAGDRVAGDFGGTDFEGRAWEVESPEGLTIVPESLAVALAHHYAA